MKKLIVNNVLEMENVSDYVLSNISQSNNSTGIIPASGYNSRAVVALYGDLGAGKTTFIQTLAKKLRVKEVITSPTFVVMKKYNLQNQYFKKLIHIDAYRIEEIDEMRVLGFEDLLKEEGVLMCIEWAENISSLLPKNTMHINIKTEEEKRIITITHEK